ncbi:glycosyltransferase [Robertmurraya massiliosenegalensis]|uniref:glycosyltransferase n=1 Tax=Robertmurraya TaxID=2837507 RepID=UPI0039A52B6F
MKKKKILFIMQSLQGGGAERVTLDVIRHLDKDVFEPSILIIHYFGELTEAVPADIEVTKVLTGKEKSYFHPFKVFRTVLKAARQVDGIVGSLEMTPTYLAAMASVITRTPAIGWVHIDVRKYPKTNEKMHRFLINRLYRKLNTIIAVSNGVKRSFEVMFPQVNVPVKRIYNPVRIKDIHRMMDEKVVNIPTSDPVILGIGRLTEMKGFDDLIKAHKYLLEHQVKTKLVILGEGPQRRYLESLIKELEVEESVELKGFVHNPYAYIRSADVFALSSIYEGFSVVVAEALAVGIPVVSTDCPSGPAEILADGKYGLLSPVRDYQTLALNIVETLNNEDRLHHEYERIKRANEFSFEAVIPEFEKVFKGLGEA